MMIGSSLFLGVCIGSVANPIPSLSTNRKAINSTTVVSSGTTHIRLRVEAETPEIIRLWYSSTNSFNRKKSQALEETNFATTALKRSETDGEVTAETNRILLRIDKKSLQVTAFDRKSGSILVQPIQIEKIDKDGSWTLMQRLAKDEHLLGLGQDNRNGGKLDRRGTIRELWAGQQINSGNVTAQYPVPFMLSTGHHRDAYGIFFDNTYRLKYDLGKTDSDRIRLTAAGGECDFYILAGPTPKKVISEYTAMTGRPSLPPLWSLGYWQSRCVFYNWNDIDSAYQGLTSRGYPVDTMVIDYNWPEVMNDFVWDKRWTVDGVTPGNRVGEYKKKGVHIVLSNTGPMLKKESPTYDPGWKLGVLATDGKGNSVQGGYFGGDILDFTSPNMNKWLYPQLEPRNKEGIAAWWLDLTEPEGEPPQTTYHDGGSAEIHNQFSMRVTRAFEGSLLKDHPNERPFILTRAGSAGIQRYGATLWSGDIYSDYSTFAAHPGEMQNSAVSGINWWTCDTGGFLTGYYKDDQFGAHARLYERWMQFSVFSPITRAHKAGLCMPYEFGPTTEQGTKKYLNLRYRMLPYIYSHAFEANQTGIPLIRPLAVEFPDDINTLNVAGDEYMFGKNMLVAPVTHEGISKRSVYFPAGNWIDWDNGYRYKGGQNWVVDAPQNRIPVAIRAGAIIPLAPSMTNTSAAKWDPITLEVFPSGISSFELFNDDSKSFDYRKGKSTLTKLVSIQSGITENFSISESNKLFVPKTYAVEFHLDRLPLSVTVDGAKKPYRWNSSKRILTLNVASGSSRTHRVVVRMGSQLLSPRMAPKLIADVVDAKGESKTTGKPIPNFFPAPELPNIVKAVNYDKGGEGIAFHLSHAISATTPYRLDNAGVVLGTDSGGGYALGGLQKDDWLRYSINANRGGFFDLVIRCQGAGSFRLLSADRTVIAVTIPAGSRWQDVVVPNVYLNPGEDSLLLYVDKSGFQLNSLLFKVPANPPNIVEAEWGQRTGQTAIAGPDANTNGSLKNVGQLTGTASYGIDSPSSGLKHVKLRYAYGGPGIKIQLSINGGSPIDVNLVNTGGGDIYKDLDIEIPLDTGANSLKFSWKTTGYDSATFDRIELPRQN